MGRAPCCDKASVKKGPWSPEEDFKLKSYIEKFGTGGNWIALPQKIGLKRCGKSCRLRWLNYLRPNIKHGGFTEEEDNLICSLYISIGSRWSIIAAQLPGRTDNDIKNYWNTRLKKKLLGRHKKSSSSRVSNHNNNILPGQEEEYGVHNLSSSALERLQLHMHLQNPLSLFNNPALWPKLNQMIQTLNQNQHHLISSTTHQDYHVDSMNCFSSSSTSQMIPFPFNTKSGGSQMTEQSNDPGFAECGELEDLINNKSCSFVAAAGNNQTVDEFDCFKDMDGAAKENLAWWSNELEVNSTSTSNSWDSAPMIHQSEEMYQDYDAGFSM